ncbi:SusC/RagA family TonB-linked outer membrane protein [Aestuariibaculum lutulentum]|uniref:TonB-dependent receptor n=1 Tax=Aestuariibaculum lutulentum TaxID=2920935 RepID=A0ABS9RGM8_9FLAO|nr:TonB-dependent receptor [Aestuariibaculum lutulentum]MCH4551666.1 TonB-dependent receptor [Aestuariibaculum lutulentum]
MKRKIENLIIVLVFSLVNLLGYAQETNAKKTVTGVVVDATGIPLPGVNVVEKGTTNGVVTNFDGEFDISVSEDGFIVLSFVGMKTTELSVKGQSEFSITLEEDTASLDEVVIVGYGAQKRENLTGAIATIKPNEVQDLPVSNLAEALVGQVPGMSISGGGARPGESASIQIRQTYGFSKDGSTTIPLVVIDDMVQVDPESGKPTLETFNRLDPSEIESITVLKDGSAAIYGSRASQGAIVVKTKRGKEGKTQFSYNSQFAINDAVSHSKTMSAYEFGLFNNRFLRTAIRDNNGANLFSTDELEEMKSLNYDWLDEAWSSAVQQRHSLNVSGGTEKATYFAGATYFTQGANLGNQDFDKWNFRTGVNAKITSNLDLSASISGNTGSIEKSFTKSVTLNDGSYGSRTSGEQADYGVLLHMPKYVPWDTTVNGETYWMSPFPRTDGNLRGTANTNSTIAGWNYFATLDNGSKQIEEDNTFNVNLSLNYKVPFIEGLSLKGTFSRNEMSSYTEQIQLPYTLARNKIFNTQGNHLASAADDDDYDIQENRQRTRVYYGNYRSRSTQSNFFMNYVKDFGDHDISAMVGMERSESDWKSTRLAYEGTSADYLGTFETAGEITGNSTAYKGESGVLSYLGRINYSYKDKYLLQLLFRSDASTKFAPENYWGFFPSAQVGWITSREDWFQEALPWVDYLKVRYSIGKTGNDNVLAWRWKQLYGLGAQSGFQFGSDGGVLGGGLTPEVNPNRNVGWDANLKQNLGFDVNVLENRLKVTADFYYDRTKDMLTVMSSAIGVPISVGGGFAEQNYAAIDTWGSEFSVNWNDKLDSGDFSYNVDVNFGFSGNEVKKYIDPGIKHPSQNQRREGVSLFMPVWGFKTWKGTSTGDGILRTDEDITNYWNYLEGLASDAGVDPKYLDITSKDGLRKGMLAYQDVAGFFDTNDGSQAGRDGRITKEEDYVKLADNSRTYGFTTNIRLNYKSLYLRSQISTSWGGARFIDLIKQGTSSAHNMWSHESYWTDMYDEVDNVDGKYPNLWFYDQSALGTNSDFWQLNTFRCFVRNLTVGYDVPKDILEPVNLQKVSIGITGNNLWDFYNPYPDKYRNMYDSSYERYPTLRTWTVNLSVSF